MRLKGRAIDGIELVDLALYLKEEHILVMADLHIGIEEELLKNGVLIPKFHFRDLVKRVEGIFEKLAEKKLPVDLVVINGDLKHEFGTISDEEWRNTLKLLDYLIRKGGKVVLVKGNHDKTLGPIADKRGVLLVDQFIVGDKIILHGDKMIELPASIKTIIIGHDHPAISLNEDMRKETYKCFMVGKYRRKNLIVQPSMNPLTEGADILERIYLSPFLKQKTTDFEVYIVADKVYDFGKLKKLAQ
ncbi:MAG: metallophosphoesterase [Candidatus Woesearchaeota archaeon]